MLGVKHFIKAIISVTAAVSSVKAVLVCPSSDHRAFEILELSLAFSIYTVIPWGALRGLPGRGQMSFVTPACVIIEKCLSVEVPTQDLPSVAYSWVALDNQFIFLTSFPALSGNQGSICSGVLIPVYQVSDCQDWKFLCCFFWVA